jgi:hypothetical protein
MRLSTSLIPRLAVLVGVSVNALMRAGRLRRRPETAICSRLGTTRLTLLELP